jgi:AAA+ superfamily predicted ATPase
MSSVSLFIAGRHPGESFRWLTLLSVRERALLCQQAFGLTFSPGVAHPVGFRGGRLFLASASQGHPVVYPWEDPVGELVEPPAGHVSASLMAAIGAPPRWPMLHDALVHEVARACLARLAVPCEVAAGAPRVVAVEAGPGLGRSHAAGRLCGLLWSAEPRPRRVVPVLVLGDDEVALLSPSEARPPHPWRLALARLASEADLLVLVVVAKRGARCLGGEALKAVPALLAALGPAACAVLMGAPAVLPHSLALITGLRTELPLPSVGDRESLLLSLVPSSRRERLAPLLASIARATGGAHPGDLARVVANLATFSGDLPSLDEALAPLAELGSAGRAVAGAAPLAPSRWGDVFGYEAAKKRLREFVDWPFSRAEAMARFGLPAAGGIFLYGPSGCGKTLLVRALCAESGLKSLCVSGPALLSGHLGEAEKNIRDLFKVARLLAPSLICLDEVDAMAGRRAGVGEEGSAVHQRMVAQLLTEMDGVTDRGAVFLVACSSRPDLVDPALLRPGRLDTHLFVGRPTTEERAAIVEGVIRARAMPVADPAAVARAASERSEGLTGADLQALCREAALAALRANPESTQVTIQDFESALSLPEMLARREPTKIAFDDTTFTSFQRKGTE